MKMMICLFSPKPRRRSQPRKVQNNLRVSLKKKMRTFNHNQKKNHHFLNLIQVQRMKNNHLKETLNLNHLQNKEKARTKKPTKKNRYRKMKSKQLILNQLKLCSQKTQKNTFIKLKHYYPLSCNQIL